MIERVMKGAPITLAQNIGLYLTPIHVLDVCEAMISIIQNDSLKSGSVFNISGDKKVSLREIVAIISSGLGKKAQIEVTDGEVKSLRGSSFNTSRFIPSFRNIHDELRRIIKGE
jgi:nucleoside-diphosphate-sugar epimerase